MTERPATSPAAQEGQQGLVRLGDLAGLGVDHDTAALPAHDPPLTGYLGSIVFDPVVEA